MPASSLRDCSKDGPDVHHGVPQRGCAVRWAVPILRIGRALDVRQSSLRPVEVRPDLVGCDAAGLDPILCGPASSRRRSRRTGSVIPSASPSPPSDRGRRPGREIRPHQSRAERARRLHSCRSSSATTQLASAHPFLAPLRRSAEPRSARQPPTAGDINDHWTRAGCRYCTALTQDPAMDPVRACHFAKRQRFAQLRSGRSQYRTRAAAIAPVAHQQRSVPHRHPGWGIRIADAGFEPERLFERRTRRPPRRPPEGLCRPMGSPDLAYRPSARCPSKQSPPRRGAARSRRVRCRRSRPDPMRPGQLSSEEQENRIRDTERESVPAV